MGKISAFWEKILNRKWINLSQKMAILKISKKWVRKCLKIIEKSTLKMDQNVASNGPEYDQNSTKLVKNQRIIY